MPQTTANTPLTIHLPVLELPLSSSHSQERPVITPISILAALSTARPVTEGRVRFQTPAQASTHPIAPSGTNPTLKPRNATGGPTMVAYHAIRLTDRFIETRNAATSSRSQSTEVDNEDSCGGRARGGRRGHRPIEGRA